jgi:hypothetical protein
MAATGTANAITLKGSTDIVGEYLCFALNNILYQRGVYPHEMFSRETKYDLPMMLTNDPALKEYLNAVTTQLHGKVFRACDLCESVLARLVANKQTKQTRSCSLPMCL